MTKTRNLSDLLDANGDVKLGNLDNVPASNDASALTTGTLPIARIADGDIALAKLSATGTKDATTFLRGDNSFIGVPVKKITVNDNITTQYSGLGGTVTNTLTDFNVTHTALSTSNKLAFFISIPYYLTLGDYIGITRFKLNNGTSNVTPSLFYDYIGTQGNKEMSINASYFDLTPASTNAITYTIQIEIYRPQGTSTITIGQSDNPTRLMCVEY